MTSHMQQEVHEVPEVLRRQSQQSSHQLRALATDLRSKAPSQVFTLGRGSSAHAADYLSYLLMQGPGVPSFALPMSLMTLHESCLNMRDSMVVAISQSGQSPDLNTSLRACRERGALTVALVNQLDSPLALGAHWPIDLCAGPERSVAATKSCVAAMQASLLMLAHWQQDTNLLDALARLPRAMETVRDQARPEVLADFVAVDRLMVIGRGQTLPVAREVALKLKETCAIQAEAYSGAEVLHGPQALVNEGYPVLILASQDAALASLLALALAWRQRGAHVVLVAPDGVPGADLDYTTANVDVRLQPLLILQHLYPAIAKLAVSRGHDPDRPRFLSKVTCTF